MNARPRKLSSEYKPTYTVCRYHEGLAESFAKFREVFWPSDGRTGDSEKAQDKPSGSSGRGVQRESPPTFLFLKDSEVLGHITSLSVNIWFKGTCASAYWVVGFMVLPEYRSGPVGVSIIKKVNETLPIAMTLTVEQAPLRIFKGLGWVHAGILPQYLTVLRPGRLLQNVDVDRTVGGRLGGRPLPHLLLGGLKHPVIRAAVAGCCSLLFHAIGWRRSFVVHGKEKFQIQEERGFDDTFDDLWDRMKQVYQALVVRDRAYLTSRYGSRPGRYRILSCRREGRLEGFFVVSIKQFQNDPRMGNSKVGTIVDCLFDPGCDKVFVCLLLKALHIFREEGADAALCTASFGRLGALMKRYGFVAIPGNLNFVVYDKSGILNPILQLESWHLMRGDCDADGNF